MLIVKNLIFFILKRQIMIEVKIIIDMIMIEVKIIINM